MIKILGYDLNEYRLYIFGCGADGISCYDLLKRFNLEAEGFVDNGNKVSCCGKPVNRPENLLNRNENILVIVASELYEQDMVRQLIDLGIACRFPYIRYGDLSIELMKKQFRFDETALGKGKEKGDILYDYQSFSCVKTGGVPRYFYELITRINKEMSCDFFEGFFINEYEEYEEKRECFRYYGEKIDFPPNYLNALNSYGFNQFVQDHTYKIYHPTNFFNVGNVNYKTKVVTVYDMIHELFNLPGRTLTDKKNMIATADHFIAISKKTKDDLQSLYGISDDRIDVIYLANSLHIKPTKNNGPKKPYILYVGNRGGYKNARVLMEAFAISRVKNDMNLVFFGGGKPTEVEREFILKNNLSEKIHFTTGDDKELANAYYNAEIFVYPSDYEGFGLPILEAMYYETPVITTRAGSLEEVGADAAIYFDKGSKESLVNEMEKTLYDSERKLTYEKKGKEREKMFSWEKCADQTLQLYRRYI